MCGIAGKIHLNSEIVKESELSKMSNEIIHRGPDDEGMFISDDRKVGLVSRRLAILDLSKKGHQPMVYKGRYWIVFNGEIYNFQQESKRLEKLGYKFNSRSDTEVILALYNEYGVGCLEYLRGMFAFAIYDLKREVVFLARDRMGVKPLKYYWNGNTLIFASELKAILTQPEVKSHPDWLAIHHYLTLGYCPSPMTGFKNIYKLEPAGYLLVDLKSGQIEKKRYWHLDFNKKLNLTEKEWKEKILTELETATKLRMISDVPIGAFLSGGVDSSAVVAMMAKNSSKPIKTFTIGFKEKSYDETAYAQKISEMFGTEHETLVVEPQSVEIIPDIAAHYEEPFADSSSLISCMVSGLARKKVKVVLNGDGSDESFGGYLRHTKLSRDAWLGRNNWIFSVVNPVGKAWPRLQKFISRQSSDIRTRFLEYNCYFTEKEKTNLYIKKGVPVTQENSSYQLWLEKCLESEAYDVRDECIYADLGYYFADSQLTKIDMATMRVGLEARSPFSDYKMMELAAQIPYDLKIHKNENKYILKRSLEEILPMENLYRKKMGFSIPLSKWFEGDLKRFMLSHLSIKKSMLKQMFKTEEINLMLDTHSLSRDYGPKLWSLLVLQLWWERYFV